MMTRSAATAISTGRERSGRRQETPGALFFTFEGGKIKESRQYFDAMTLLKQIGAQPE